MTSILERSNLHKQEPSQEIFCLQKKNHIDSRSPRLRAISGRSGASAETQRCASCATQPAMPCGKHCCTNEGKHTAAHTAGCNTLGRPHCPAWCQARQRNLHPTNRWEMIPKERSQHHHKHGAVRKGERSSPMAQLYWRVSPFEQSSKPHTTNVCHQQHCRTGPKAHPHIPVLRVPAAATPAALPRRRRQPLHRQHDVARVTRLSNTLVESFQLS